MPGPTSAFGKDGEAIAQPTGGEGMRGWLSGIYKAVTGVLTVRRDADVATTGNLEAVAGEVKAAVVPGMTMLTAFFKGVYSTGTVVAEVSFDGGTTWVSLAGVSIAGGTSTFTPLSAKTNEAIAWEAAIPAGVTHLRARCTAITSGKIETTLVQGSAEYETTVSMTNGTLNATSSVIGGVFSPGLWTDISSTNLGSGASVSSAVIDTTAVASATAFTNASVGVAELRGSATADKAGTLWLEVSRDNVTYKKVKKVALVKEEGGEFYAEIIHKPSTRYAKFTLVNGAEAQGFLSFEMFRLANL